MANTESSLDDYDVDESRKTLLPSFSGNQKTFSKAQKVSRLWNSWQTCILIAFLIATNVYWIFWRATVEHRFAGASKMQHSLSTSVNPTYYGASGTLSTPYLFQWWNFVRNQSSVYNESLWIEDMPAGGGMVSLPRSTARSLNLSTSYTSPFNPTHELFLMEGYHQVHCLIMLKETIFNLNSTGPTYIDWDHILHCMDALRQALWCHLDDTLLAVTALNVNSRAGDGPPVVDGQIHQCKNRSALKTWTERYAIILPD